MEQLQLGEFRLTWLKGGVTHLDGGAMFGVVPKPLWSRKYQCNEQNQVELRTDPILLQAGGLNLLIDSGIGNGKLTAKQKRNFGVTEESQVEASLAQLGLSPEEIDYVLLTHLHFDHACGLTKWEQDKLVPVFPKAKHVVSQVEWAEMRRPNIRSQNTYWRMNWEPIQDLVVTYQDQYDVMEGIRMVHTGGHSAGHSVIFLESQGERGLHFGDLMATHAHRNPLWVMAYDDYPIDSIFFKEKWVPKVMEEEWWLTFYHDKDYRAVKWNGAGEIIDQVERLK